MVLEDLGRQEKFVQDRQNIQNSCHQECNPVYICFTAYSMPRNFVWRHFKNLSRYFQGFAIPSIWFFHQKLLACNCRGRQERQSLQAAFQNCSHQCPNYSRMMQRSRGITTNSWWLPGASPTISQKVSKLKDAHSHSHGTRCLRRSVNQERLLHG